MTRRAWIALVAALAFVLVAGRLVAGAYVEYRWFATLGRAALDVWRARALDLLLLRGVGSVAAAAFAFANLFGVRSSVASLILPRRLGNIEIGEEVSGRRLVGAAAAIAAPIGLALGLLLDDWTAVELLRAGRPFALPEPYTGRDLAFFTDWLPLEETLYAWTLVVLLVNAALVLLLYGLTTSLRWERGRVRMTGHVRRHLALLGGMLVLLVAWGHRLDAYELLSAGTGPGGMFSHVDRAVALPARFGLAAFTALASFVVVRSAWLGQTRVTFWAITGVLGAALLFREIVPALAARTAPSPDGTRVEAAHAANRAAFTQVAYGVIRVERAPPGYGLRDAGELVDAVPVWDPVVLGGVLERVRRTSASARELGWQPLAGRIAALSLAHPAPPDEGAGAGPIVAPLWEGSLVDGTGTSADGAPQFLEASGAARDDAEPALELRPLVYPGADARALVDDSTGAVAGDPVGSFGTRLAHAWRQRDLGLLFSDEVDRVARPEVLLRRDVHERLDALVPFFTQGRTAAPAFVGDSLVWIVQLYAASSHFPLSQHYAVGGVEHSYFRHAAVAVVNAHTGRVLLIPSATPDPIAVSWIGRFSRLFTLPSAVPPALAAVLPPATESSLLQAAVIAHFGARPDVGAAALSLPGATGGDSTLGSAPRALSLLPSPETDSTGAASARVPGWTLPLLAPSSRVAGVLVALGGASPRTLWVPAGGAEPRWHDLAGQLRSAADSVAAASDARGEAEVVQGRLRVVPVAGRLVYVQPAYVRAADGRARVAVVAVSAQQRASAARDLAGALGVVRAARSGAGPAVAATSEAVRARVRALYAAMRDALRRGDWRAFGLAFDSLGALAGGSAR